MLFDGSKKQLSAQSFLANIQEKEIELQVYGLEKLNEIVHSSWHEISEHVTTIEQFMDEPNFPKKQLAASLASKVFYHLDELDESLRLALEAGDEFDIYEQSLYVDALIRQCIDSYIQKRVEQFEERQRVGEEGDQEMQIEIDPKMEAVVNKMFQKCFDDGQITQAIGIAVESRRLDMLQEAIEKSGDIESKTSYTFTLAQKIVKSKNFRTKILNLLLSLYQKRDTGKFDSYKIAQCQFLLSLPKGTASLLIKIVNSDHFLEAYQIAFDIVDKENQDFQKKVLDELNSRESEIEEKGKLSELRNILSGEIRERLNLQFLKKNNHTDTVIIQKIKEKIGPRSSIFHCATVWANGIMNAYTTNDSFLKDNIQWAATATNWNRFVATSTLGVIHMGNKKDAMTELNKYFSGQVSQDQGQQPSPYATAGAYYAYGLVHQNQCQQEYIEFLLDGFRNSGQNENIQHGVSLGLGLVAMGSQKPDIYEELKNTLFNNADSAIIGEAAAYGVGLVMLGSADQNAIEEMITHAQDSQHEKIIRALAISLAFMMYGKEEQADTLIMQMTKSKDAIMRYGAMFAIGCAYAGTENNQAVKRLLNHAVSDVNDDVKRAALMNLGFLLFRSPKIIPETVKHLAESYNPHLRYGSAMAVGIGCAGTGLSEAIKLLAPLTDDKVDFVRQGALLALSMVFVQVTEAQEPKVATIKKLYSKMVEDKHEETLTRQGAIWSQGILNAAGRNATISLSTKDGNLRQNSVVGLVMFLQYWYWYPLLNFLPLSFVPTNLIALDQNLKVPKSFSFVSNAQPSQFKYPEFLKLDDGKKKEKVKTATLSTTAKVKARQDRKKAEGGDEMEVDKEAKKKQEEEEEKKKAEEEEKKKAEEEKKKNEPEPTSQELKNPSRVVRAQEAKITYSKDSRYTPVLENRFSGFILLQDSNPESETLEEFWDDEERDTNQPNPDQQSDMDIPKPFEFDPDIQNAK